MDKATKVAKKRAQYEDADYIKDARNSRLTDDSYKSWHERIETFDRLYGGQWSMIWPDKKVEQLPPSIMNLPQVGADEFSRLMAEVQPQAKCEPDDDKKESVENAYLREQIAHTHWMANFGEELLSPQFGMDLAASGFASCAISTEPGEEYPVLTRLDPRGSFPNIVNNRLMDMMVIQRVPAHQLKILLGVDAGEIFANDGVASGLGEFEIVDLYDKNEVSRTVVAVQNGEAVAARKVISQTWEHNLGRVPVGWARLVTGDGKFRGLFDQVKGIVEAQNTIFKLILDYSEQATYAPFFAVDVENDEDPPGPRTIYRGRSENSRMERISPAGSNPQLFPILEYLDRHGRGQASYPEQRQGHVGQSIASASFVHSTMGQMTTTVKAGQKAVAMLRAQTQSIGFQVDEEHLDESKALMVPAKQRSYKPSKDIKGRHRVRVIYGAGAGLDAVNRKQVLDQDAAMGLISMETAREQTDYLLNPGSEAQKVEKEKTQQAILQRMLTDPNVGIDLLLRVLALQEQGKSLGEAAEALADLQEQERAAQQATEPEGGGVPTEGVAPPTAEDLAAGELPPEPSEVEMPPPPNAQMLVRQPPGA